jgi:hypothetical protein
MLNDILSSGRGSEFVPGLESFEPDVGGKDDIQEAVKVLMDIRELIREQRGGAGVQ